MLKLFIRLALAALLANAAYRVGSEYLSYIRFRDAVRDAAMFKTKTDADLQRRIMELAFDYDLPLVEGDIVIHREDRHVWVEGRYKKPIELVPSFFYPWPFAWSLDVITSTAVPFGNPRP